MSGHLVQPTAARLKILPLLGIVKLTFTISAESLQRRPFLRSASPRPNRDQMDVIRWWRRVNSCQSPSRIIPRQHVKGWPRQVKHTGRLNDWLFSSGTRARSPDRKLLHRLPLHREGGILLSILQGQCACVESSRNIINDIINPMTL